MIITLNHELVCLVYPTLGAGLIAMSLSGLLLPGVCYLFSPQSHSASQR